MQNRLLRPAQVLAAFLLAMGRFQSSLGAPVTAEPAAAAVNALGIDLLKKTSRPDANALLSPYSIQSALAMAYAGAEGVTREEMAKVLHYPKDEAALHAKLRQRHHGHGPESVRNAGQVLRTV